MNVVSTMPGYRASEIRARHRDSATGQCSIPGENAIVFRLQRISPPRESFGSGSAASSSFSQGPD